MKYTIQNNILKKIIHCIIYLLSIYFFLSSTTHSSYAQEVFLQWEKVYGGNNQEQNTSILATSDGGYLLGGYSFPGVFGNKMESDYWIVKTDAWGNKKWDKYFGGSKRDEINIMLQTSDGGYLLGGQSQSGISGNKNSSNKGGFDYWIVKIDAWGNKKWDKNFGGNEHDFLRTMISTPDGGYLLGGTSFSNKSGDKSQNSKGANDYWIIKIDVNGNKQWDKVFGGNRDDGLTSMLITSDSGYLLGGTSSSDKSGDKTTNSIGGIDFWIVKIDAWGNKKWDKSFGSRLNILTSMLSTPDGGYLLGGVEDYYHPWLVKINAIGDKIWDKYYIVTGEDYLTVMVPTSDGGYVLGGDASQFKAPSTNCWVMKIDKAGNKKWHYMVGDDNGNDRLNALINTSDGGLLLGLYSYSVGDEKPHYDNFWINKLSPIQALSFTLINAYTNQPIPAYDPIPKGAVLDLAYLPKQLSIRANTPQGVGSVVFNLSGSSTWKQTENYWPFALFGGAPSSDYNPWKPSAPKAGHHFILKATPYAEMNATGTKGKTLEIKFSFINSAATTSNLMAKAQSEIKIFPNRSEGEVNIQSENEDLQAGKIQIYNSYGSLVHQQDFAEGLDEKLDLKKLGKGLYFCKIYDQNANYKTTRRILIE